MKASPETSTSARLQPGQVRATTQRAAAPSKNRARLSGALWRLARRVRSRGAGRGRWHDGIVVAARKAFAERHSRSQARLGDAAHRASRRSRRVGRGWCRVVLPPWRVGQRKRRVSGSARGHRRSRTLTSTAIAPDGETVTGLRSSSASSGMFVASSATRSTPSLRAPPHRTAACFDSRTAAAQHAANESAA